MPAKDAFKSTSLSMLKHEMPLGMTQHAASQRSQRHRLSLLPSAPRSKGHDQPAASPVMLLSANLRFCSATARICSSMVAAASSRTTSTLRRCPMRWARAWACRSICGFQSLQQR